jgi:hypothetical protein
VPEDGLETLKNARTANSLAGGPGVEGGGLAGGVTTSVVTLVTALEPDASTDLGGKAFGILQSLRLA